MTSDLGGVTIRQPKRKGELVEKLPLSYEAGVRVVYPLPDYTPDFYMPEASAGATKDFKIPCVGRKVK